ncbi:unnamed protein product [Cunninghamella blakesleeana]
MAFLNGFKKNLNRAGQLIMQRTGASDKTADNDLEKKSEKLSKETKAYLDSIRGNKN